MLAVSAKLLSDYDAYVLSQPGAGGPFEGGDRDFLLILFNLLLGATVILTVPAFIIVVTLKWRRVSLEKLSYSSIAFWIVCVPIVAFIAGFSTWALWQAIHMRH
jgi:hypothetical protein